MKKRILIALALCMALGTACGKKEVEEEKTLRSVEVTTVGKGDIARKKAAKDGDDGRKIYISLTAKGESAVQEMVELLAETAAVVFDCMDAHRRMQIYKKVQELLELFNTGGWKE